MILKNKQITAAIFDMDGTMFDTERLRMKTLKRASMELFGKSIPDQLLTDSLGLSSVSAMQLAKKEFGEDYPYEEIRKRADELEMAYVKEFGVPVKKGLIEVLERLKRNEILLAVATSSKRMIAEEYLHDADVYKYFDVIVCGDEVTCGKPHPEIFLTAASRINCNLESCLIIEDSENGLLAASKAEGLPVYIKDIKEPRSDIKEKTWCSYDSLNEFLHDLRPDTKKYPVPALNEHFPQNNNQLTAGIHGFGAIGGGYIAQIFSHWDGYTRPSRIIGATRNLNLRNMVNAFNSYHISYKSIAYEQSIRNVSLIDIDSHEEMVSMYLESEIIAICLPEDAIRHQAKMIAAGLLERSLANKKPLTILIILNKINAASFVKKQVKKALLPLIPEEQVSKILNENYFCETVVNRMVSSVSKDELTKQIQRSLNSLPDSIADTKGFKKPALSLKSITRLFKDISQIQNYLSKVSLVLFHSEPDMILYAGGNSPLLPYLRQIKVIDNIGDLQTIKNRLSNGTHAMIAWYSALLGYKTIGQGMGDERISQFTEQLINREIKPALLKRTPEYKEYISEFTENFIKRCRFSFKDPVSRVGRDPIRKLQHNERILGTIYMIQECKIPSSLAEFGAALGFYYGINGTNVKDKESMKLKRLYDQLGGIESVLTYSGELDGKPCRFLNPAKDKETIYRISHFFHSMSLKSRETPA